jgi:hypothetical protein
MSSKPAVIRGRTVADSANARQHRQLLSKQAQTRREMLEAEAVTARATEQLAELERQRASARAEIKALKAKIAQVEAEDMLETERMQARAPLSRHLTELERALDAVNGSIHSKEDELLRLRSRKDGLERMLTRDRLAEREALAAQAKEAEVSSAVAAERTKREQAMVRAAAARQQRALEQVAQTQRLAAEEAAAKLATAKLNAQAATVRVKAIHDATLPAAEEARRLDAALKQERTTALLQLRRSIMAVEDNVRSSAAAKREADQKLRAEQAAEFDRLLREGKNPYEEFRRRARDAEAELQAKRAAEAVKRHQVEMADAIVREDGVSRRREAAAAEAERRINAGRPDQRPGGEAAKYLASHTKGGADVLDPTGRAARIDPSSVTVMRTHAFGTGAVARNRPDILGLEKDRPAMAGVEPDPRWLPARESHPDDHAAPYNDEDSDDDGGEGGPPIVPDQVLSPEPAGMTAEEEHKLQHDEDDPRTHTLKRFGARGLGDMTALEKRLMDQAHERHRQARVQKQVVLGREFKGRSMVPSPATVEFVDFEPGVAEQRKLVLTNGSFTFVSFRVGALPDAIADMFDIDFVPPGRMSAGTSVPLTIHFRPPAALDDDILAEIDVDTSTGKCPVPLRCTAKKALPRVQEPIAGAGAVVRGESASTRITLKNDGALPLLWRIVDCGDPQVESGAVGVAAADDPTCTRKGMRQAGDSPWRFLPTGKLAGYGTAHLPADCLPGRHTELGKCSRLLRIEFTVDVTADDALGDEPSPLDGLTQSLSRNPRAGASTTTQSTPQAHLTEEEEARIAREEAAIAVRKRRAAIRVEPIEVLFTAEILPLPLFVNPDQVDMRVCGCPPPSDLPAITKTSDSSPALFRASIMLRNRGKTSIKASLSLPPVLAQWVELVPPSCYVQAPGTLPDVPPEDPGRFRVTMRIKPDTALLTDPKARAYFLDPENKDALPESRGDLARSLMAPEDVASCKHPGSFAELTVPVTVRGAGQTLPVFFTLRAGITIAALAVTPSAIDFGKVPIGQATCQDVTLVNLSALPLRYGPGSAKLPRAVSFAAGGGMGTLLAAESATDTLVFAPTSAEAVSGSVMLRTSTLSAHRVSLRGRGVQPFLKLGMARVCLPAVSPGERADVAVPLSNVSNTEVLVQLLGAGKSPDSLALREHWPAGLALSPAVFRLKPKESRLVRVVYAPETLPEASDAPGASSPRQADVDEETADAPATETDLPPSHTDAVAGVKPEPLGRSPLDSGIFDIRTWIAAKPVERDATPQLAASAAAMADEDEAPPDEDSKRATLLATTAALAATKEHAPEPPVPACQFYALDLQTVVTPPKIIAEPSSIKFGSVPAGREVTAEIKIECAGALPVTLEAAGLNPGGAFHVVNAPRAVVPGKTAVLIVAFHPLSKRIYSDTLKLRAAEGGGVKEIRLAGKGATPDVVLERKPPEGDPIVGHHIEIDLGDVVAGDEIKAPLKLRNASAFAMTFTAESTPAWTATKGVHAIAGRKAFEISPCTGTAPPDSAVPMEVSFRSDVPSFESRMEWEWILNVPNYEGPALRVTASARVWPRQAFVAAMAQPKDTHARFNRVPLASTLLGCNDVIAAKALPPTSDADSPAAVTVRLEATPHASGSPRKDVPDTSTIAIGNCQRPASATAAPVAFRIELPTAAQCPGIERIQLSSLTGTVQPGQVQPVTISLAPKKPPVDAAAVKREDSAKALGLLLDGHSAVRELRGVILVHLDGGSAAITSVIDDSVPSTKSTIPIILEATIPSV